MKLTIVYDNEIYNKETDVKKDWGFSCLIETRDDTLLFDTGANGSMLLNNMNELDIDPGSINKIVISHEHWDHSGGLESLVAVVGDAQLYRLGTKNPGGAIKVTTVEEPQKIVRDVWTTGRLNGSPVDEQSLVLNGKNGWYVLAGCSHPGVKQILDASRQVGKVVGLFGGLHGFDEFSLLKELDLVGPAHCTKHKKKIYELFPKTSIICGVGKTIEI